MAHSTYQQMSRSWRKHYFAELKHVIGECMRIDREPPADDPREARAEGVRPLRRFIRKWFRKGAPIDYEGQGAPAETLRILIRQMCLHIPTLSEYRTDALIWLSDPYARCRTEHERLKTRVDLMMGKNPPPYGPGAGVPWNLALSPQRGTYYDKFNALGIEVCADGTLRRPG